MKLRILAAAVVLGAIGTGSILGWSANAVEAPVPAIGDSTSKSQVDLDSLYAAKTNEAPALDTSYLSTLTPHQALAGRASWYGPGFYGRRTANGEIFQKDAISAAHKTLPFGSIVRVTDEHTGKSILVRINDRGPYCGGRIIDLSDGAARQLGIKGRGTASVRCEVFNTKNGATVGADGRSFLSFDESFGAVRPHGFSLRVATCKSFDEAINTMRRLQDSESSQVYLTQVRSGKETSYEISLGLFNQDRSARSLAAELAERYPNASVVRFEHGTLTAPTLDVATK